ncbi:MAG TPA: M28 family peptidase [Planctomycetaceae bacterium]|nr:M28 family peptidase [Planctomycetaceae bacterium]
MSYDPAMILSKPATVCISLLILLVIESIACLQYVGPSVVSEADADASTAVGTPLFSAERALEIHRQLFNDSSHPAGSVENDAVRGRLVHLLQEQGWSVEVQTCNTGGREPLLLHNVVAHRPEQEGLSLQPLVLASHYDSCRFGPGAGDAGSCVAAVIEAGRLLTLNAKQLKRPVWLLFTDGEEGGLLGAREFVATHPLSQQRPLVLNFDARGSAGPVVMYETHSGNLTAVSEWVNQLARPIITGSLFTAVYRSMPNGTDFSVFQQAGWQGFNFAIIDGAHRYHQPDDTLANLDPRSVQHLGEQALKMSTFIAANSQDLAVTKEDTVFFDVFGLFVVHYPVWWCLPIRFALFFVAVQLYGRHVLRRPVLPQAIQVWCTMLIVLVASIAVGWIVSRCIMGTAVLPRAFVWYGHALSFAMWCLTMLLALSIAHWMLRRIDQRVVWDSFWLGQATTCLVVSIWAPEFSHLLSIPGAFAIILTLTIRSISFRTILAVTFAGVMLIPMQHLLAIALGPSAGMLLFPAFVLIAMPMLPAMGRMTAKPEPPPPELDKKHSTIEAKHPCTG